MKHRLLTLAIPLIIAGSILQAVPSQALDDLPIDHMRIDEVYQDTLEFPGWAGLPSLPGHTVGEGRTAGGGGGAGGEKGGDSSGGGDKTLLGHAIFVNPRADKRDAPRNATLQVFRRGRDGDSFDTITLTSTKDFSLVAKVEPVTVLNKDGVSSTQTGVSLAFKLDLLSSQADIAKAIFARSGSTFSSCAAIDLEFICTLKNPRHIASTPKPFVADFAGDTSTLQVPLCSGVVVDGGYGKTTVISTADVSCEAAPDKEPVRLDIETILSDTDGSFPTVRGGDGSIVFDAPASLAGKYTVMRVWAIAADGTTSWPFYVAIRNRFTPTAESGVSRDVIRGVDTVIPRSALFADEDVDKYSAESGDRLTSVVTSQGALGAAWFDASGNLHYRSIDVVRGSQTDTITVQTTDSFGLPSNPETVAIHIADITPGCASGGIITDSRTPVRIHLECSILPVVGWTQIDGLHYALEHQPAFGTVSDVDPIAGTLLYTPDENHPGPVVVDFIAENNGALRAAQFTVNVLPAP